MKHSLCRMASGNISANTAIQGNVFMVSCLRSKRTRVPGQFPAGAQPGYPPPYAQAPTQAQDDPLLAGPAAGSRASRKGRNPLLRSRRPGSRLRGCGCLLLILAVLAGPFIGVALTNGRPHLIFTYVAGGMVIFIILLLLIGMLATRRGQEALSEGCADGCLEAIFGGFLGGGESSRVIRT